jgi:Spy/CpxP family protein refolding chaperone
MKSLMILAMAAMVALVVAGSAMANGGSPGGGSGKGGAMKAHALFSQLDLTDTQKASIKAIMTQARTDAKAATDKPAKREIFKTARKAVLAVLTDAQRAKLKELRKAACAKHAKPAPTTPAPAPSN